MTKQILEEYFIKKKKFERIFQLQIIKKCLEFRLTIHLYNFNKTQ